MIWTSLSTSIDFLHLSNSRFHPTLMRIVSIHTEINAIPLTAILWYIIYIYFLVLYFCKILSVFFIDLCIYSLLHFINYAHLIYTPAVISNNILKLRLQSVVLQLWRQSDGRHQICIVHKWQAIKKISPSPPLFPSQVKTPYITTSNHNLVRFIYCYQILKPTHCPPNLTICKYVRSFRILLYQ